MGLHLNCVTTIYIHISLLDLAVDEEDERSQHSASSDDSSTSDSDSDSSSDSSGSDDRGRVKQEYLDSLLEKAMKNAEALETKNGSREEGEDTDEEEIILTNDTLPYVNPLSLRDMVILKPFLRPIPRLNPGTLPAPYIKLGETRLDGPSSIRDPEVERAQYATASSSAPAPPIPPPELTKSGKPLTKREKKEVGPLYSSLVPSY